MNKEQKQRYDFLVNEITRHDILYEQNHPEIGDTEYDDLYFELLSIEKEFPTEIAENSPSQKINTELVSSLKKETFLEPMLSQQKIKTLEELNVFVNSINGDILGQEKLDGLTIVLTYENGRLKKAVTRGNGYVGEIVTHTVKTFTNLPKLISFKGTLILRAEALILKKVFEEINTEGQYSNERNLASGTVRQLDSKFAKNRKMKAIIFEYFYAEGKEFLTDSERLDWIKSLGFEVVNTKLFKKNDNFEAFIQEYIDGKRDNLEYPIDGLVFKSNDLKEREKLGYTSKFPKWATAFKFKSRETSTVLRECKPQVGKTGKITPVAIFDKINIDVDIQKATLNNYNFIKKLDVKIGDTIIVARSNDVIPKITTVIKTKRTGNEKEIEIPKVCPICGSKTEFIGENLYCIGINCPAQIKGYINNFVSRDAMNINGLGIKNIDILFEKKILNNIQDIYLLKDKKEQIIKLEGFGEKKYNNIIKSLEETKHKNLYNLIYALSIRLIGLSTAKDIANHFLSLNNIIEKTKNKNKFLEECNSIVDFGPEKSNSLYEFFSDENNLKLINFLINIGLNTNQEVIEKTKTNNLFENKVFVITGDLNYFKNRNELVEKIESNGGKVSGSISKKTSYLINNDLNSMSSKNKDAKKLNIPIITEEDFLNLVKENNDI